MVPGLYLSAPWREKGWISAQYHDYLAACSLGWVFFFSPSPGKAFHYLGLMAGIGGNGLADGRGLYLLVSNGFMWLVFIFGAGPLVHRVYERIIYEGRRVKTGINCTVYSILLFLSVAYLMTEPYMSLLHIKF